MSPQDAISIRRILDLLAGPEPITTYDVALTQHMGDDAALRLMHKLERAGLIEHPTAQKNILGVQQAVPQIFLWQMTEAARRGEVCTESGILTEAKA